MRCLTHEQMDPSKELEAQSMQAQNTLPHYQEQLPRVLLHSISFEDRIPISLLELIKFILSRNQVMADPAVAIDPFL